jgi:hypothetical protein
MAAVLRLLFDDEPRRGVYSDEPDQSRFRAPLDTFSEGVREVIDARVYSGFIFGRPDERGAKLGRQVGQIRREARTQTQHD